MIELAISHTAMATDCVSRNIERFRRTFVCNEQPYEIQCCAEMSWVECKRASISYFSRSLVTDMGKHHAQTEWNIGMVRSTAASFTADFVRAARKSELQAQAGNRLPDRQLSWITRRKSIGDHLKCSQRPFQLPSLIQRYSQFEQLRQARVPIRVRKKLAQPPPEIGHCLGFVH